MRKNKTALASLIAIALLVISAAGCGTTSSGKATASKTPATPTPPAPTPPPPADATLKPLVALSSTNSTPTPVEFEGSSTNLTGMKGGVPVLLVNNTGAKLVCRMVRNDGGGTLDSAPVEGGSATVQLKPGEYTFIWLLNGAEVAREAKTVEIAAKYGRVGVGAFHAISSIAGPK